MKELNVELADVLLLNVTTKDYNIDGKSGKYSYAEVIINGLLHKFKIEKTATAEKYADLKEKRGTLVFTIKPVANRVLGYFVSFQEE